MACSRFALQTADASRWAVKIGLFRLSTRFGYTGHRFLLCWQLFPWEKIYAAPQTFEMVARYLPDGMKMTVIATLFENVFEFLLGYEGLFYSYSR